MTVSAKDCGTKEILFECIGENKWKIAPEYCLSWKCMVTDCRFMKVGKYFDETWKSEWMGWVDAKVWNNRLKKQADRKEARYRVVSLRGVQKKLVVSDIDIGGREHLLQYVFNADIKLRDFLMKSPDVSKVFPGEMNHTPKYEYKRAGRKGEFKPILEVAGYKPIGYGVFIPEDTTRAQANYELLERLLDD